MTEVQKTPLACLPGTIKTVCVKNFMCHKYLSVTFERGVNIVTGQNGSGKSAILTALIILFGGGAHSTNRAQQTAQLIKTGCSWAEILISINNNENEISDVVPYNHDVYGDEILIQKRITSSSSTIKVRNAKNGIVSCKAAEVKQIVAYFNIQVNNPICILNQEISKKFLSTSNDKAKYAVFHRATTLSLISGDIEDCKQKQLDISSFISMKKASLPDISTKIEELSLVLETFDKVSILKELIEDCRAQMAINEFREVVEVYMKKMQKIDQINLKIKSFDEKIEMFCCLIGDKEGAIKVIDEECKSLLAQILNLSEEKQVIFNKQNEVKAKISVLDGQIDEARGEKHANKNNVKELYQKIEQIVSSSELLMRENNSSIEEIIEKKTTNLLDGIKLLEKNNSEVLQNISDFQHKIETNKRSYEESNKKLKSELDQVNSKSYTLQAELVNLQHRVKNQQVNKTSFYYENVTNFGWYVPELYKNMEVLVKNGTLKNRVIGPIGACIKLKQSKFAYSVECALKNLLNSFVVSSIADKTALIKLLREKYNVSNPPMIVVYKNINGASVYKNDTNNENNNNFLTMLDVVESMYPALINVLIDLADIDRIYLFETLKEANDIMMGTENASRIKNIKKAFTCAGDEFLVTKSGQSNVFVRFYSSKIPINFENKAFDIAEIKLNFFIVLDEKKKEDLSNAPERIAEIEKYLSETKLTKNELEKQMKNNEESKSSIQLFRQEIYKLEKDMKNNKIKIAENQNKIEQFNTTLMGTEGYQSEINEINATLKNIQSTISECKSKRKLFEDEKNNLEQHMNDWNAKFKRINNLSKEKKKTASEMTEQVEKLKTEIQTIREQKIAPLNDQKMVYQAEVQNLSGQKDQLEGGMIEKNLIVNKNGDDYEYKQTDKDVQCKTNSQLNNEIKILEVQIEKTRETLKCSDKNEIEAQLSLYKERFGIIKSTIEESERFAKEMEEQIKEKSGKYSTTRKWLEKNINYHFKQILGTRGFEGDLSFDHENQSLTMKMNVNGGRNRNENVDLHDVRGLSGGEKSFSTLAFILSLWKVVDMPFRCLDEFDVFMDNVNRKMCFNCLFEYAERNQNSQMIILTPQDVSDIVGGSNINLYRLEPPAREI